MSLPVPVPPLLYARFTFKNNPHMVKNLWGQIFGLDIGMTACIGYACREGRGEIYREYTEC